MQSHLAEFKIHQHFVECLTLSYMAESIVRMDVAAETLNYLWLVKKQPIMLRSAALMLQMSPQFRFAHMTSKHGFVHS